MPAAAGTYSGRVLNLIPTTVGDNDTECAVLQIELQHQWDGRQWVPIAPFERKIRLFFSEKSLPHTRAKLDTIGFNGRFDEPAFSKEATEGGVQFVCKIVPAKDNPTKTYEEWDFASWGNKEVARASDDKIRALNARWAAMTQG